MKILNKTISATIEVSINIHSVKCNAILQIFAGKSYPGKTGKMYYADMDIADYENVFYMGLPIENGHKGLDKLKNHLNEFGVNLDKILGDEVNKLCPEDKIIEMLLPQLESLNV